MMDHILIIGSTGRIGRMVMREWRARGLPVVAQIRRAGSDVSSSRDQMVWDISQGSQAAADWIEQHGKISCFVVLAGVTPATGEDMDDNLHLARAYLDAARSLGVPRVLLASSSAVYGLGGRDPSQAAATPAAMSEATPCTPLNAYGESKLRMEAAADAYRDDIADICCLRIGNVAGADALLLNAQVQRTPAPAQIVAKRPLTIDCFGTPSQDAAFCGPLRSYIGPQKLADVLHGLACHIGPLPDRLNIAAPGTVHMDALAQAAGLAWEQRSAPQGAVQAITLDCLRLTQLLDDMFKADDSTPEQMIAEWKEVADDPV